MRKSSNFDVTLRSDVVDDIDRIARATGKCRDEVMEIILDDALNDYESIDDLFDLEQSDENDEAPDAGAQKVLFVRACATDESV